MALEQRLRAGLLAQLLAGEEPRCFWSPATAVENAAFETQHADRAAIHAAARAVFAGEPTQVLDTGAFHWTFTRIVQDQLAGVFVCGVPTGVVRDTRLTALPDILQFHCGRLPNHANLHRLMDLVIGADPDVFTDALLFASQDAKPFVLLHNLGNSARGLRSWSRWPLERLFVKRRAGIITNPQTLQKGLAVPFFTPPNERYVVVFALRSTKLSRLDRDFLAVVGCVSSVIPSGGIQRRINSYDRIEAASIPLTPRLFYYGGPKLRVRISSVLHGRGWELTATESYKELLSLAGTPFDVILLDGAAIPDTLTMLRWLRHAAPGTPILYFDSSAEEDEEAEILVDERIDLSSSDETIFLAIKNVVRDLPQRRRDFLEAVVHRLIPTFSSAGSCAQLTRSIARALVTYFGDWAAVHFFDLQGGLYQAELPPRKDPLMPSVPLTFINGYAVMKSRVDADFLEEVCPDPWEREALASLEPRSGAAVPLAHGGKLIGSMVVLSIHHELDEPDFEALSHFAETAAQAFATLQTRMQRKQCAHDTWTRVPAGEYDVDVYLPPQAKRGSFRAVAVDEKTVAIEAKSRQGGSFTATLDSKQRTLTFQASRFPEPLYVAASGPAGVVERTVPESAAGVLSIGEPSVTLIYDEPFTKIVDPASAVEVLQRGLRDGERNPAALLPALGSERIPFIAITLR